MAVHGGGPGGDDVALPWPGAPLALQDLSKWLAAALWQALLHFKMLTWLLQAPRGGNNLLSQSFKDPGLI